MLLVILFIRIQNQKFEWPSMEKPKQGLASAAQQLNLQTLIKNLAGGGVIIFAISSGDSNDT